MSTSRDVPTAHGGRTTTAGRRLPTAASGPGPGWTARIDARSKYVQPHVGAGGCTCQPSLWLRAAYSTTRTVRNSWPLRVDARAGGGVSGCSATARRRAARALFTVRNQHSVRHQHRDRCRLSQHLLAQCADQDDLGHWPLSFIEPAWVAASRWCAVHGRPVPGDVSRQCRRRRLHTLCTRFHRPSVDQYTHPDRSAGCRRARAQTCRDASCRAGGAAPPAVGPGPALFPSLIRPGAGCMYETWSAHRVTRPR